MGIRMSNWRIQKRAKTSMTNWSARTLHCGEFLVLEGNGRDDPTPLQRPLLRRRERERPSREVPDRIRRHDHYIEVQLKKEDESPLMLYECEVVLANDERMVRRTNENGVLRIDGLTPRAGPFKIRIFGG